ncbi:MAG: STAS domain-containing protein [Actinomycetota bacterium]|nr:STAS domain-containing protein [Actinomycetota bacterium]
MPGESPCRPGTSESPELSDRLGRNGGRCELQDGLEPGVVIVAGELDAAAAPELAARLAADRAIEIVDLRNVTFIDLGGLRPLLAAVEDEDRLPIAMRAPSPAVRRLLALVELEGSIPTEAA